MSASVPADFCNSFGGDQDNDGLCAAWEVTDGLIIDLEGMHYEYKCEDGGGQGPCPSDNIKDIYVEVDWSNANGRAPPDLYAINLVVARFSNSPVQSVAGGPSGIQLHVQLDPDPISWTNTAGPAPADWNNGNFPFPGDNPLVPTDAYDPGFDHIKEQNFGTAMERNEQGTDSLKLKHIAFHYALYHNNISNMPSISGYAEILGNDFVISLGDFPFGGTVIDQQAGTFMHELGHNLALNHGGNQNDAVNCKPNYLSIMSHSRQFSLYFNRPLDYSNETLNLLDQGSLLESAGVVTTTLGHRTVHGPPPPPPDIPPAPAFPPPDHVVSDTNVPIDWNRNAILPDQIAGGEITVQADINNLNLVTCGPDMTDILDGHDDWNNVNLLFRSSDNYADGVHTNPTNEPEISSDTVRQIIHSKVVELGYALENALHDHFSSSSCRDNLLTALMAVDNDVLTGSVEDAVNGLGAIRAQINSCVTDPGLKSTSLGIIDDVVNPMGRVPLAPTALTASATATQVDLSWTEPSDDRGSPVIGYMVERHTSDDGWSILIDNTGNTDTEYSDNGVNRSTTYQYRVSAVSEVGYSNPSNTVVVTTGCLIATAAFGSDLAPQVQSLRETRDNIVLQTQSGTAFMSAFNKYYYTFSPTVAQWELENPVFREIVKIAITPLLTTLSILNHVNIDSEVEMIGYGIGVILLNLGIYFIAPAMLIFRLKRHLNH